MKNIENYGLLKNHFALTNIPFLICYMVFSLIRHVQFNLEKSGYSMSAFRIIDSLRDVQASIMEDVVYGTKYRMLSKLNDDAAIIEDYPLFKLNESVMLALNQEEI